MYKLLIYQSVALFAVFPLLALFGTWTQAWSFLAGGGLVLFSIAGHGIVFAMIFNQKFVALTPLLIVSKYAILGILILKLISLDWVNGTLLGLGFCSITLGGLLTAVDHAFTAPEETE